MLHAGKYTATRCQPQPDVNRKRLESYGFQTIQSGSKATAQGFQGSKADPTGLIYLINRYYDPATDQFLSIDPDVSTTGQPYAFTNDNPLNATDPLGLIPVAVTHETNRQASALGHAYEKEKATSDATNAALMEAQLSAMGSSEGSQLNALYMQAEAAMGYMSLNANALYGKYLSALNNAVTSQALVARNVVQLSLDSYQLYTAQGDLAAAGAVMNEADIALTTAVNSGLGIGEAATNDAAAEGLVSSAALEVSYGTTDLLFDLICLAVGVG